MKIVLGISGASGAIYAANLIQHLKKTDHHLELVASSNARNIYEEELGKSIANEDLPLYGPRDFHAAFASGSALYDLLVIVPCSMGTLGRIAHGISDDLLTRTADVFLKEKRKIILVPRETPFSAIHLENMLKLARLGVHIIPAIPSFYSGAKSIDDLIHTVNARVLDHMGIPHELKVRYAE